MRGQLLDVPVPSCTASMPVSANQAHMQHLVSAASWLATRSSHLGKPVVVSKTHVASVQVCVAPPMQYFPGMVTSSVMQWSAAVVLQLGSGRTLNGRGIVKRKGLRCCRRSFRSARRHGCAAHFEATCAAGRRPGQHHPALAFRRCSTAQQVAFLLPPGTHAHVRSRTLQTGAPSRMTHPSPAPLLQ